MIRDYFGLTTGNFIKLLVLVAFLFFFFRVIHLLILFTKDKSQKELKILIVITELIAWSALFLWIVFLVPLKKLELIGISVVFNFLNFLFWKSIKDPVSLFFINKILTPINPKRLKIAYKVYKIEKIHQNYISLIYNSEVSKINYSKLLKQKFQFSINKDIKHDVSENFKDKNELYATLKDNGFINSNTEIDILTKNDSFIISIDTFDNNDFLKTDTFLKHVFL
ncbi:MAG: hypothetical protein JXR68_08120 [Bacteroidales bacterium]|nr:hypothetical protein [Bacteroidales bacterium]